MASPSLQSSIAAQLAFFLEKSKNLPFQLGLLFYHDEIDPVTDFYPKLTDIVFANTHRIQYLLVENTPFAWSDLFNSFKFTSLKDLSLGWGFSGYENPEYDYIQRPNDVLDLQAIPSLRCVSTRLVDDIRLISSSITTLYLTLSSMEACIRLLSQCSQTLITYRCISPMSSNAPDELPTDVLPVGALVLPRLRSFTWTCGAIKPWKALLSSLFERLRTPALRVLGLGGNVVCWLQDDGVLHFAGFLSCVSSQVHTLYINHYDIHQHQHFASNLPELLRDDLSIFSEIEFLTIDRGVSLLDMNRFLTVLEPSDSPDVPLLFPRLKSINLINVVNPFHFGPSAMPFEVRREFADFMEKRLRVSPGLDFRVEDGLGHAFVWGAPDCMVKDY
jgi:hypothetical protein